jgi:hypothetical protein
MEDIHIEKTHIHGHYYPLHIQPPHSTQIRSYEVLIQQTEHIQLT